MNQKDVDKKEVYEIDEEDWQRYLKDCGADEVTPNIKDYLLWCDEHDMERPEVWDQDSFWDKGV